MPGALGAREDFSSSESSTRLRGHVGHSRQGKSLVQSLGHLELGLVSRAAKAGVWHCGEEWQDMTGRAGLGETWNARF